MCAALRKAKLLLTEWISNNPNSYPPTVFNITDGEVTDGNPSSLAEEIKQLRTTDGNVLMFNIHISSRNENPVLLPEKSTNLADEYAQQLFEMSSKLPSSLIERFSEGNDNKASFGAKAFAFNSGIEDFRNMLNLGTPVEI